MGELTDRQRRFVDEYLLDLNATQAAIRSGYSAKTASSQGERLLRNVEVARAVAAAMEERSVRTRLNQDRVLLELGRIAMADTGELVEHRLGCCRFCYGKGFRYQYTPAEWEAEELGSLDRRSKEIATGREDPGPPDPKGGVGFNATREPRPGCPECFGEGVSRPVFRDTSKASPAARALYAGVKVTREGLEMKLHPKTDALELVGRHLGMFKDKIEHDVADRLADVLRAVDGRTRGLPSGR